MFRDALEVSINTAKLLLLGFSLYAVATLTKPEELQLRQGQLREWWTQTVLSKKDSTGSSDFSPEATRKPGETWGF
jgi:hypothetical protein